MPWFWLRYHIVVQTCTYTIYLPTHSELSAECNCPAFKDIISKFGRKQKKIRHCKHIHFIFVNVYNLDPDVDLFIHALTFSFNEVKLILEVFYILLLRILLGLVLHCVLMDVAISAPHVYLQFFS